MLDDLPLAVKTEILHSVNFMEYARPSCSFGIKELIYCLRQSFFKRVKPKPISLKVAARIYRGFVWDKKLTALFPVNQVLCSYQCHKAPVVIHGKLDFYDENNVLTELKFPVNLSDVAGVSVADKKQVQFYAYCQNTVKAQVLYFDGLDCKKFSVDVNGWNTLICELEDNSLVLYNSLVSSVAPEKTRFLSLCQNCEYTFECGRLRL